MSDATPATPNRQLARRQPPKSSTKVCCYKNAMGLGANVAQAILNLSESGIRLRASEPLQKGQEVEVNLESPNHRKPVKMLGNVVWAAPADDGPYCVGVQFQRTMRYADFVLFTRA